ncbi:MAG TPA: hypothetical protein VGP24_16810 [Glaciihabitans sp.]|jgi:hypothetical protein|nr:hypothetical protein [Glaciihabitans sp.]
MKRIHYAGDSLLTGNDIADALVSYAQALARKNTSATVEVPVRVENGSIAVASVLIGPASQLTAIPEETDFDEISDPDLVAELTAESDLLGHAKPQSGVDESLNTQNMDAYDLEDPTL